MKPSAGLLPWGSLLPNHQISRASGNRYGVCCEVVRARIVFGRQRVEPFFDSAMKPYPAQLSVKEHEDWNRKADKGGNREHVE